MCDFYLNIADQLLSQPEGVVANDLPDRELFSLLSHFMSDQDDPLLINESKNPLPSGPKVSTAEAQFTIDGAVRKVENKQSLVSKDKQLSSLGEATASHPEVDQQDSTMPTSHVTSLRIANKDSKNLQIKSGNENGSKKVYKQNKNNLDSLDTNFMMV